MMKATGRVNSPSASNKPPSDSITPANQSSANIGGPPCAGQAGKPNSLPVPCSMNSSAATMRSTLSARGAQTVVREVGT